MCYVKDPFVQIYMFEWQICGNFIFEFVRSECDIEGEAIEHCRVIFAVKALLVLGYVIFQSGFKQPLRWVLSSLRSLMCFF